MPGWSRVVPPDCWTKGDRNHEDQEQLARELSQRIGQLEMELEWLKKHDGSFRSGRSGRMIEARPPPALDSQCALLGLPQSSLYYEPAAESDFNLERPRGWIGNRGTRLVFHMVGRGSGLR